MKNNKDIKFIDLIKKRRELSKDNTPAAGQSRAAPLQAIRRRGARLPQESHPD